MTPAQAILMTGGLASIAFATLAGYALYWIRLRDVHLPPPRFALVTHTSATTGGLVLIALAVVIVHSGFAEEINVALASAEVAVVGLTAARNVLSWHDRIDDGMADVSETWRRLRGLGNVVHLFVFSAVLYGVARTALGI